MISKPIISPIRPSQIQTTSTAFMPRSQPSTVSVSSFHWQNHESLLRRRDIGRSLLFAHDEFFPPAFAEVSAGEKRTLGPP
jgi:hypothetical protein